MNNLERRLKEVGFKGRLLIVQADQFTPVCTGYIRKPVYLFGSGPAAAPPGAAYIGKQIKNLT